MKARKIEVTQEMLEQALRCCAKDEPSDSYPCEGCYLYPFSKDGRMSTGQTCFEHLAHDAIDYIRKLNDFEQTSAARLLAENGELERKNAILKKALDLAEKKLAEMTSFKSAGGWHDYLIRHAQQKGENNG